MPGREQVPKKKCLLVSVFVQSLTVNVSWPGRIIAMHLFNYEIKFTEGFYPI